MAHTQFYLADLLMHTGRLFEAEEVLRDAIDRYERLVADFPGLGSPKRQTAICYEQLGEVLWMTNRLDGAKEAMRRSFILKDEKVAEFPRVMWYRLRLVRVLANCPDAEFRDPQRAVELATDFLEKAPDNSDAWLYLGIAQYRLGEWHSALEALHRSMEFSPEDIEFHSEHYSFQWFHLALAHWQLGDKEQARNTYDRAVEAMRDETSNLGAEAIPRLKIQLVHEEAKRLIDGSGQVTSPSGTDSPANQEKDLP